MMEEIINLIYTCMPFRDYYHPVKYGFLLYLIPFFIGFIFYYNNKNSEESSFPLLLIGSSIITLVCIMIPLNVSAIKHLFFLYYCYLIMFLIISGYFIAFIWKNTRLKIAKENKHKVNKEARGNEIKGNKKLVILSILLIIVLSSINLIYFVNSKYLVGADIYFNAAVSKNIYTPKELTNPYLKEISLYPYSPVGYSLIKILNIITNLKLSIIWRLFPFFFMLIFLFNYFIFVRRLYNIKIAFLALILVAPLNQFLFNDASIRLIAYSLLVSLFFMTYLVQKNTKFKTAIPIFLVSLALFFYHLELFIHFLIFLIFFLILNKLEISSKKIVKTNPDIIFLFTLFFTLISFKVIQQIYLLNPIYKLMIFNEIYLSIIYPIGIISFLVSCLAIIFLLGKHILDSNDKIILSICFLFVNAFFYFFMIWKFYHRYFTETAYLGVVIFAAITLDKLFLRLEKKKKLFLLITLFIVFILTISPRFTFNLKYSKNVNNFIETKSSALNQLKILYESNKTYYKDKVILCNPNDFINRYIPFYSGFYIYAGITNETLKILPFCGKYGLYNKTCREKERLASNFFINPNKITLNALRNSYEADYILVKNKKESISNISKELNLSLIFTDKEYILYKIN